MRLQRGQLNTPIRIESKTLVQDQQGGQQQGAITTQQAWCLLLPLSTKDYIESKAEKMELSTKLLLDLAIEIKHEDSIVLLDASASRPKTNCNV